MKKGFITSGHGVPKLFCLFKDNPHLSHLMGKPTICVGENKDADQLRGNRELISAFVFATWIVQFLHYLYPKFQASSIFLCLYRPVCVRPVLKPHCWFSHKAAHLKRYGSSGRARRASKRGAPCPHFQNGKCTLPFWTPEGGNMSFSEHFNIEKYIIFYISI